jgi:hypothetical protein
MAAQLVSAVFTVAQTRLLRDRDPVAVTGAQFLAAAIAVLPVALATERLPAVTASPGTLLAVAGLALCGTVLPFTLFAFGQSRVSADVAGAFLNLEPLVGAIAGAVVFANPVGRIQALGGVAILGGIGLSGVPSLWPRRQPADPLALTTVADRGDQVPGVPDEPSWDRRAAGVAPPAVLAPPAMVMPSAMVIRTWVAPPAWQVVWGHGLQATPP